MDDVLEKIYKAGLKFLDPLGSEETYKTIVDEAVKLVDADYGSIALLIDDDFQKVYSSSPDGVKSPVRKRAFAYQAVSEKRPLIVNTEDIGDAHPELRQNGIVSTIHIPLSYKNNSIGVLIVNSKKPQKFGGREMDILKLYGSMASLAIRKTQLYDETKKALEIRDLFISLAAHELRTPLTSVNGYVQLLNNKMVGKDTPESRWVEQLSWECLRLTNLASELLTLNRIKAGQLQFFWKECHLREIIDRALDSFSLIYPKRVVEFSDGIKGGLDVVIGDYDKLIQVVNNLLDNAVKFSAHNSNIKVSLNSKNKLLVLQVADSGQGISKKDLSRIFEGFYKGVDNQKSGIGLGLYLTKSIIKEHRGEIVIKSKEDKGTVVEVKLPLAKYAA